MATGSRILAWEIPWTEEPGRYSPQSHKESDKTELLSLPAGPQRSPGPLGGPGTDCPPLTGLPVRPRLPSATLSPQELVRVSEGSKGTAPLAATLLLPTAPSRAPLLTSRSP